MARLSTIACVKEGLQKHKNAGEVCGVLWGSIGVGDILWPETSCGGSIMLNIPNYPIKAKDELKAEMSST